MEDGGRRVLWVHLQYTGAATKDWLDSQSGIDPVIVQALTAEETGNAKPLESGHRRSHRGACRLWSLQVRGVQDRSVPVERKPVDRDDSVGADRGGDSVSISA